VPLLPLTRPEPSCHCVAPPEEKSCPPGHLCSSGPPQEPQVCNTSSRRWHFPCSIACKHYSLARSFSAEPHNRPVWRGSSLSLNNKNWTSADRFPNIFFRPPQKNGRETAKCIAMNESGEEVPPPAIEQREMNQNRRPPSDELAQST
jgi:hypothetical protein